MDHNNRWIRKGVSATGAGTGNTAEGTEAGAGTGNAAAGSVPSAVETAMQGTPGTVETRTGSSEQDGRITAIQAGSAGTIQVTLPEGWTYEACSEGSEQLRVGDYGIHFYPEDASEGFIELCYVESFGVLCASFMVSPDFHAKWYSRMHGGLL